MSITAALVALSRNLANVSFALLLTDAQVRAGRLRKRLRHDMESIRCTIISRRVIS